VQKRLLDRRLDSRRRVVCGSGGGRCCRGIKRCVHVSLWFCRVIEISTDVLVAGAKLVPRLTYAEADGWGHCLGPSYKIRCSSLKTFLRISKMRRSMASMSGLLAYAVVLRFCSVRRMRALDLSRLPAAGACADVHRSFQRVWPCIQKNVISCLVHRSPVLYLESSPW
jgi:hypothetical protein